MESFELFDNLIINTNNMTRQEKAKLMLKVMLISKTIKEYEGTLEHDQPKKQILFNNLSKQYEQMTIHYSKYLR